MLKKLSQKLAGKSKILIAICVVTVLTMAMTCVAFASDGNTNTSDYSSLVTQLNSSLGASSFISVIGDVLPYITAVTLVSLVWYLIRRAIKKFAKGKPGV